MTKLCYTWWCRQRESQENKGAAMAGMGWREAKEKKEISCIGRPFFYKLVHGIDVLIARRRETNGYSTAIHVFKFSSCRKQHYIWEFLELYLGKTSI
jgi:hypothetical protein